MRDAWNELGLRPPCSVRDVKRAYARLLKKANPEDDPDAFQKLREAYEWALRAAEQAERAVQEEYADLDEPLAEHEALERKLLHRHVELEPLPPDPQREVLTSVKQVVEAFTASKVAGERALNQAWASPLLVNLDAQQEFEDTLAETLAELEPFPEPLANMAARKYGWLKAFEQIAEPSPAVTRVLNRMSMMRWAERLRELATRGKSDDDVVAAKILLGREDRWSLPWSASFRGTRSAVTKLLRTLEMECPAIFEIGVIDPRTLALWHRTTTVPLALAQALLLLAIFFGGWGAIAEIRWIYLFSARHQLTGLGIIALVIAFFPMWVAQALLLQVAAYQPLQWACSALGLRSDSKPGKVSLVGLFVGPFALAVRSPAALWVCALFGFPACSHLGEGVAALRHAWPSFIPPYELLRWGEVLAAICCATSLIGLTGRGALPVLVLGVFLRDGLIRLLNEHGFSIDRGEHYWGWFLLPLVLWFALERVSQHITWLERFDDVELARHWFVLGSILAFGWALRLVAWATSMRETGLELGGELLLTMLVCFLWMVALRVRLSESSVPST